jgi:predicted PolB exonuclease-like 3'-5' exonuclease
MKKYTVWIILSLVAVFALGTVGGVFGERYAVRKKWQKFQERRRQAEQDRPRFPTLEMMAAELALTEEQQQKIQEAFQNNEGRLKEMRTYMHTRLGEIRNTLLEEIKEVLTSEQRQGFEAMLERYAQQRKEQQEKFARESRREQDRRPPPSSSRKEIE